MCLPNIFLIFHSLSLSLSFSDGRLTYLLSPAPLAVVPLFAFVARVSKRARHSPRELRRGEARARGWTEFIFVSIRLVYLPTGSSQVITRPLIVNDIYPRGQVARQEGPISARAAGTTDVFTKLRILTAREPRKTGPRNHVNRLSQGQSSPYSFCLGFNFFFIPQLGSRDTSAILHDN